MRGELVVDVLLVELCVERGHAAGAGDVSRVVGSGGGHSVDIRSNALGHRRRLL